MRKYVLTVVLGLCAGVSHAQGVNYSGTYMDQAQMVMLTLEQRNDGSVVGQLQDEDEVYNVTLGPAEGNMVGAAQDMAGENYPVLARLQDGVLYFKVYEADSAGNVISESGIQVDFYPVDSSMFSQSQGGWPQQGQMPGQGYPGANQGQAGGDYGGMNRGGMNQGGMNQGGMHQGGMNQGGSSQLAQYLAGKHFLVSWRDGGAVYGTYTFLNTHFCANGTYAVYANTHKQSVLGGENRNNWTIHGRWQVVNQGGQQGVFYQDNQGGTEFVPLQMTGNGLYVREGVSVVLQGQAQCY